MNNILEVKNIDINFGGLKAVEDLSFSIAERQLCGLIGPNGAGKTTVFNMLTGVYAPSSGEILLAGKKINGLKPYEINRLGIARTFQNIRLFRNMTVLDNVLTILGLAGQYSFLQGALETKNYLREERMMKEEALNILAVFDLEDDADKIASNLPYGKQRQLEICRALASHPKLLLLDEPAAGMNPQETADLMDAINTVRDYFEVAILLIEHDMKLVMGICEEIIVLNYGKKLAQGSSEDISHNSEVIKAYIGE